MKTVASLSAIAVLLVLWLGSSDAGGVIKAGSCPRVAGQASLDLSRYLGKWYEYERFPAIFEAGLDCTDAEYALGSDGKVSVTNAGFLRVTIFGKTYVINRNVARGNATVPDPSKPAELSVTFGFGPTSDAPNYFVQNTDYDNYSVVFSCVELPGFSLQFAWILTRERGVAPANLSDLRAGLAAANVDVSNFFVVNQRDCPSDQGAPQWFK